MMSRLDAAATAVSARESTSPSRARQVRWVAGELRRALAHEDMADLDATVDGLFTGPALNRYLTLARDGALRVAPYRRTTPSPASERVRLDCLALLAAELGRPMPEVERPLTPVLRDTVPHRQQRTMWSRLDQLSRERHSTPGRTRLLSMVGIVLDTGARAGELCAMHIADLSPDLSSLRLHRRPQARRVSEPELERQSLCPSTQVALRYWLEEREAIVSRLDGSVSALWVSVRGNHVTSDSGATIRRPAGLPLHPRGLRRAYERAVDELNVDLAGTAGWVPLPSRLEQLRRGTAPAADTTPPG